MKCIVFPLVWLLDISLISDREWIQLPLLTYLISITRLIIAQTWVELCLQGYIVRTTNRNLNIDIELVAFILFLYTLTMFVICLLFLYCIKKYITRSHYDYFIELSVHMTGYGLLFLCVHIQYEWFSNDLTNSWLFFIYLIIIASSIISIIILCKQFIFKLSMDNRILDQYVKYLRFYQLSDDQNLETSSLIHNHNHKDSINSNSDQIMHRIHSFWFTVFEILQNFWSIAIGFIMIECLVYSFVGDYINLLVNWTKSDKHLIKSNITDMIFAGFIMAFATAFAQGIVELSIKRPCYQYVDKQQKNPGSVSQNCYQTNIFLLNFSNDIDSLWMEVLSAGIGWSLLTPNQAKDVGKQFKIVAFGTIGFVVFGILTEKYKMSKQNKILNEMNEIKSNDNDNDFGIDLNSSVDKEKLLMDKTRKLILYDKLEEIYNGAFAVSIFAWETFASLHWRKHMKD